MVGNVSSLLLALLTIYCTSIYCATTTVGQMRLEGCKNSDPFFIPLMPNGYTPGT